MDAAILERLMIDDALGALSPDVRALLQAHLSGRESELAQWHRVADTAKLALPPATVESLPPFPRRFGWRMAPSLAMGLAAAAVLLLGIGIGWRVAPSPSVPIAAAHTPAPPRPVATAGVTDFWSSNRLVAVALDTERHAQPAPHWNPSTNNDIQSMGGVR